MWFKNVATEIEGLAIEKYKSSNRKIIQLLQALEEVQGKVKCKVVSTTKKRIVYDCPTVS